MIKLFYKFLVVTDFKNAEYFISGLKQIIDKQNTHNLVLQKNNEVLQVNLAAFKNEIPELQKENDQLKKENKLLNNNNLKLIKKVKLLEKQSRRMGYEL